MVTISNGLPAMNEHEPMRRFVGDETENETNDSPIEQVRLTVPITDDPTLPVITFRTWVLGPISCIIEAFTQQYFSYRQYGMSIPPQCFRMLHLPIGRFMAATLPTKPVRIPWTKWTLSMNPGPFNIKEHVLISVFTTSGLDNPFGLDLLMMSKIFYKKNMNIILCLLLTFTTQVSGYGFAGIFMKFLVDSPLMWWPLCLVDVAVFRALHEEELRPKGHLTRLQFLLLTAISSFAYSVVPNYFFPSIGALSVVCWIWKDSVLAQQIGSGRFGLGIGSVALDWIAMGGAIGNPLAIPTFAVVNLLIGFILFLYIVTPIAYWSNSYNAKRFPFSAYDLLDFDGQIYNTSRIVNERDLSFNQNEYREYSKIYMSTLSIYSYGFSFAVITSVLTDFLLSHGRDSWRQLKKAYKGKDQFSDVHNRLMKKYSSIPQWWFYMILVSTIGVSFYTSEGFGKQTQLPYWGVLLAYLMVFILILPFGVLQATTGQTMNVNEISQMIMGYVYPGKPLANLAFRAYGVSTMAHAHSFLSDFKLAHYMKIPPKSMFFIQVIGTILSTCTSFAAAFWLLSTVDNICDVNKLPVGSPRTCPDHRFYFSSNIIWGLVGPSRVFAPNGLYSGMYYFFGIGIVATLVAWIFSHRLFPKTKWIGLVNVPMILTAPTMFPTLGAVNYWSAFMVAIFFNYYVYRKYKGWWAKYNYLLAYALDMGVAFMFLLLSFTLQPNGIYGVQWWGLDVNDHCTLAQCPTAPGTSGSGEELAGGEAPSPAIDQWPKVAILIDACMSLIGIARTHLSRPPRLKLILIDLHVN
ncbi:Oligopeptide transporter [Macleaya cordata]|uniref:Oligopeptide transporter n=1 Tax=Macleaya cordata TaxID=56857 RepID=A0A200RAQ1_MACCD|nr:Oligopeptide transporter [Macleaya cordata]